MARSVRMHEDRPRRVSGAVPERSADSPALRSSTRMASRPLLGAPAVLALQRSAGNRATGELVARKGLRAARDGECAVQRHASFEHTLLGNTPPGQLGNAAVTKAYRSHLLEQLHDQ